MANKFGVEGEVSNSVKRVPDESVWKGESAQVSAASALRIHHRSRLLLGVLCVLAFVILSDTRDIVLERHIKVENAYDYLLVVFGITTLFYATINRVGTLRRPHASTPGFSSNMLWLNAVTASNWLGWYLSLRYMTAPALVALYASVVPMATLVVNRLLRSSSTTSAADWISTILLMSCAVAWAFANILSLQGAQAAIGVGLVVMCSFSIAATTVVSKRLADIKVPTSRMMAHRFYLLLGVALYMASPLMELLNMAIRNYQVLVLAATVGSIVSLWLLQQGIQRCEPVLTVVIIATSPAFSLVLYLILIGAASIEADTVAMSIAVVLIAVFHTLLQHRNQSRLKSTQ
jgi:drug/metabolite transporter (DMT)-like permease